MKNKRVLSTKQQKLLAKKIIEYFFNNPHANSSKEMEEKFNINQVFIRKTISEELKRRLKKTDRIRKI
jgi:translation initiation factor 2 beta subunit (eIF-2beta)/eIF-5